METETIRDIAGNETLKTIFERRAVRKYRPQMIDDDILEQVLSAARMAPSAMNGQPWKFYVVTHQDTIITFSREIAKIIPRVAIKAMVAHPFKTFKSLMHISPKMISPANGDPIFHGAPVVIFITSPKDNEWGELETGMCAQNIMLAARSLGLDSCPIGLAKYIKQTPVYHRLDVSATEVVQLAVALGYAAEKPEVHPRAKHTTIFIDRVECC